MSLVMDSLYLLRLLKLINLSFIFKSILQRLDLQNDGIKIILVLDNRPLQLKRSTSKTPSQDNMI